jgi:PAS domain S-box-containing protein
MRANALADLLETRREELLARWRRAVGAFPDAPNLDDEVLEGLAVASLDGLCEALRADASRGRGAARARSHHPRFEVGSIVRALDALRTCVHDMIEDGGTSVTPADVRALSDVTCGAMAEAVSEHARRHLEVGLPSIAEAVFNHSPMVICILEGSRHTFTFANPAYRQLFNKSDPVGKNLLEVFPELVGQGWEQLLDRVASTGQSARSDEALIRRERSGTGQLEDAFFNFVYSPKPNAAGEIDGVLVSAIDVTESVMARRRVEHMAASLRRNEERLRHVVEAARMGTWEIDVGSTIISGDAGYRALMGLPAEGPLSVDLCVEALHPDDRAAARRAITLALSGENNGQYAVEHRTAERAGAPMRWVEARGQARFGPDGKAVGMAGTSMDVTARKEVEAERQHLLEAARRSEEDFRTLAELIPQQVWTSDPAGALNFINGRAIEYFAESEEQILGAGWQSIIHPDDLRNCLDLWSHSLKTGDEYEVEFRLRRADGQYRWHLGRAVPRRDAMGRIVKWFGTSTDFDEAKKIRDELNHRTELERHLLGIVSHDLRNPLSVITMSASMLARRDDLDERAAKSVSRIQKAAARGTRMIRDLLDFTVARLGGAIAIARRPVNLPDIVRAVIDEEEASHPERRVRVTEEGDGHGNWDGDRVAQLVENLVSNALKYSPPGSPIGVTTRDDGAGVALSVHNEGPPIRPENLSRIFEPLQRATEEIDRTGRSVGLGLYIVREIVSAHGGTVEVTSNEGGTTFTAHLPRG